MPLKKKVLKFVSRITGKTKVEKVDLYKDSKVGKVEEEIGEEYEDTTTCHLDPVGKATSSHDIADLHKDSLKVIEEFEDCGDSYLKCEAKSFEPIEESEELTIELIKKRAKERKAQFEVPGENPNFDLIFDFFPNEEQDLKEIRSLMVEASYLVGCEIKIGNGPYVKVITVKMFEGEVILELEEKVGNQLIYHEIPYKKDLIKGKTMINHRLL